MVLVGVYYYYYYYSSLEWAVVVAMVVVVARVVVVVGKVETFQLEGYFDHKRGQTDQTS